MSDSYAASLAGKAILVTGGSLGLGLATARACLHAGARVAIAARNADDLASAKRELDAIGSTPVVTIRADVGDASDVTRMYDEFCTAFGTLHGVIHVAGVYGPIGPITEVDPTKWFAAMQINLFGTFLVAREGARRMKATGGGRIVLFSGGGAATPFPNYTAYAASKAGVVRMAETIAIELAPDNIAVNALAPGFVITRLHEQTLAAGAQLAGDDFLAKTQAEMAKGGVSPEVGANCAVFLVSDAANGITGKFVAAPYDGFLKWPERLAELESTDIFTLRRILPKERGMDWQ